MAMETCVLITPRVKSNLGGLRAQAVRWGRAASEGRKLGDCGVAPLGTRTEASTPVLAPGWTARASGPWQNGNAGHDLG